MPTFDVPVVGRKDGIVRKVAFRAPTIEDAYQQAQDEGHIVQAPPAPSHPAQPAGGSPDLFKLHTDLSEIRLLLERRSPLQTRPVRTIASGIALGFLVLIPFFLFLAVVIGSLLTVIGGAALHK